MRTDVCVFVYMSVSVCTCVCLCVCVRVVADGCIILIRLDDDACHSCCLLYVCMYAALQDTFLVEKSGEQRICICIIFCTLLGIYMVKSDALQISTIYGQEHEG